MKDKRIIVGILVLFGILAGSYFFKGQVTPTNTQTQNSQTAQPASSNTGTLNGNIREFRVIGKNFAFTPTEMRVKKGEIVRVIFDNTEGFHDFRVDGYNVGTKQIYEGSTEAVEFTANQTGSFEYYCSVGQHRQAGMKGTLVVE